MAYLNNYGIDVSVDEFIDACDGSERQEILTWVKDNRHITHHTQSLLDQEWSDTLKTLETKRVFLSLGEEQIIKNISNKF
jgi:hypothetical protein